MNEPNKPDRLVILNKGRGPRYEKQFFFEIQEAILGGYRIADTDTLKDVSMRNYRGHIGRAVFYKEGAEPKKVVKAPVVEKDRIVEETILAETPEEVETLVKETSKEINLDDLTKKAELLAYAKGLDIEIPDDVNSPFKIKKIIKEAVNK